jgi:hypothetical protein
MGLSSPPTSAAHHWIRNNNRANRIVCQQGFNKHDSYVQIGTG